MKRSKQIGVIVGFLLASCPGEERGSGDSEQTAETGNSNDATPTEQVLTGSSIGEVTVVADSSATFATSTTQANSTTGGGEFVCDIVAQDCPIGSKCVAFAATGVELDGTHCVAMVDNPGVPGSSCTVTEQFVNQKDSCDEFSLCWFVQEGEGTCISICSDVSLLCSSPEAVCVNFGQSGLFNLCIDTCDPLDVDCPVHGTCFPGFDVFLCTEVIKPVQTTYGGICTGLTTCDDGLFCVPSGAVPGCEADQCCTIYCDTGSPNQCPSAPVQECISLLGANNPDWGHVGFCGIP